MKKPHWFRPLDLIYIFCGALVAGLTAYAAINKAQGPAGWQILMSSVSLLFFVFFAITAYQRKKWLDTFEWLPTYNLMVQLNGYSLPAASEVDQVVSKTVRDWSKYYPGAGSVLLKEITWVYFSKGLDETPMNPAHQKVKGLTIAGTHTIYVDFDNKLDSLERTAFQHELGHLIYGNVTGGWNQDEHHEFMRTHGLT